MNPDFINSGASTSGQNMNIGPLVSGIGPLTPLPVVPKNPVVVTSKPAQGTVGTIQGNTNKIQQAVNTQAQNKNTQAQISSSGLTQQQYDAQQQATQAAADKAKADALTKATVALNGGTGADGQPINANVPKTQSEIDAAGGLPGTGPNDQTSSTGNTTSTTGTSNLGTTDYTGLIKSNMSAEDKALSDFQDSIKQIQNGTFPLSSTQQALLSATQTQFQQTIEAQKIANQNLQGGVTSQNIASGLERYAPNAASSNLAQVVAQGTSAIAKIETDASAALAKLEDGFQTNNLTLVKDSYDAFTTAMNNKTAELQKMQDAAVAAQKDARDFIQTTITKPIQDIAANASKNGAPPEVLAKINAATTVADAVQASVGYATDPTSTAGMYNAYVTSQNKAGKTPMSAGDFIAAQKYAEDLAAAKAKNAYSYSDAYNAALAKANVDASVAGGDKNQQKLEKDYSTTLLKELSNRSGGLGLQDQKVNQAIHLKALYSQYATTDSKGNTTYNIPKAQYAELVLGLSNLLAASGSTSDADRQALMSKTAAGDLKGALQYITGTPQNGNTQDIINNLVDSINRQGEVAQGLRDQDVQFLHGLAPTDLDPTRQAALEKNLLPSFTNPTQNVEMAANQAKSAVDTYTKNNPKMLDKIKSFYAIPGANDITFIEYARLPGSGFDNYGDLPQQ